VFEIDNHDKPCSEQSRYSPGRAERSSSYTSPFLIRLLSDWAMKAGLTRSPRRKNWVSLPGFSSSRCFFRNDMYRCSSCLILLVSRFHSAIFFLNWFVLCWLVKYRRHKMSTAITWRKSCTPPASPFRHLQASDVDIGL